LPRGIPSDRMASRPLIPVLTRSASRITALYLRHAFVAPWRSCRSNGRLRSRTLDWRARLRRGQETRHAGIRTFNMLSRTSRPVGRPASDCPHQRQPPFPRGGELLDRRQPSAARRKDREDVHLRGMPRIRCPGQEPRLEQEIQRCGDLLVAVSKRNWRVARSRVRREDVSQRRSTGRDRSGAAAHRADRAGGRRRFPDPWPLFGCGF
jgi:hypothetical protein